MLALLACQPCRCTDGSAGFNPMYASSNGDVCFTVGTEGPDRTEMEYKYSQVVRNVKINSKVRCTSWGAALRNAWSAPQHHIYRH
eukprot:scaffold55126_cov19-Prasinocladus_malaysianus.AAC.2